MFGPKPKAGSAAIAQAMELSKLAVAKDAANAKAEALQLYTSAVNLITFGLASLKDKQQAKKLKAVRQQYCTRIVALGGKPPALTAKDQSVVNAAQQFAEAALAEQTGRGLARLRDCMERGEGAPMTTTAPK